MQWHDAELPKFFSDLLGDVGDEIWRLKGQGHVARVEEFSEVVVAREEGPNAGNRNDQVLQEQLKVQKAEIDALKGKYKNLVFAFVVFVLGLVLGKLLLQ